MNAKQCDKCKQYYPTNKIIYPEWLLIKKSDTDDTLSTPYLDFCPPCQQKIDNTINNFINNTTENKTETPRRRRGRPPKDPNQPPKKYRKHKKIEYKKKGSGLGTIRGSHGTEKI